MHAWAKPGKGEPLGSQNGVVDAPEVLVRIAQDDRAGQVCVATVDVGAHVDDDRTPFAQQVFARAMMGLCGVGPGRDDDREGGSFRTSFAQRLLEHPGCFALAVRGAKLGGHVLYDLIGQRDGPAHRREFRAVLDRPQFLDDARGWVEFELTGQAGGQVSVFGGRGVLCLEAAPINRPCGPNPWSDSRWLNHACENQFVNPDASLPVDLSDHLGPVSYVAVEFPKGQVNEDGFSRLIDVVDNGLILVIDLEFVRRGADGSLVKVSAGSLDIGVDLSAFEGADAGLLDPEDLDLVAQGLAEDSVLAVLVYEDLALAPVLSAWGSGGARLVAEGPVAIEDLEQALGHDDTRDR